MAVNFNKILVIGDRFPDSFGENITVTLESMGYTIRCLPVNPFTDTARPWLRILSGHLVRALPKFENYLAVKLLKKAMDFQPDLVLATTGGVPPPVIRALKNLGAITVAWFTDPVANLDRQYLLAAPYNLLFFKDPYMVRLFRERLEKNTHYLPEACNPLWHRSVDLTDTDTKYFGCELSLAGNLYYYRALILEHFLNYQVKIWGPGLPRWLESPVRDRFQGKYVAREEKAKAFRAAKINLNSFSPSEILGVNCRTFEIAGCGGFQIAEFRPELPNLFEMDKEIVTYTTLQELKEKVAYYLAHDQERQEIALRSQARAHRDHTYEVRLQNLLQTVAEFAQQGSATPTPSHLQGGRK